MSYDYQSLVQQIDQCQQEIKLIMMSSASSATTTSTTRTTTTIAASPTESKDNGNAQAQQAMNHEYHDGDPPTNEDRMIPEIKNNKKNISALLERTIVLYQQLSQHCPMTPVLWIQYGYVVYQYSSISSSTASTSRTQQQDKDEEEQQQEEWKQLQLDVIQLGLQEFPGYALLHLHYIDLLLQRYERMLIRSLEHQQQQQEQQQELYNEQTFLQRQQLQQEQQQIIEQAISMALTAIGHGSHQLEAMWVVILYRMQVYYYDCFKHTNNKNDNNDTAIWQSFVQRSRIPMLQVNDDLIQEYTEYYNQTTQQQQQQQQQRQQHYLLLEQGKRCVSKVFGSLYKYEQDIEIAMQRDGLMTPIQQETLLVVADNSNSSSNNNSSSSSLINDNTITNNYVYNTKRTMLIRGIPNWDVLYTASIALSNRSIPGMGYGGIYTAQAFVRYVQALQKYYSNSSSSTTSTNPEKTHGQPVSNNPEKDNNEKANNNISDDSIVIQEMRTSIPGLIESVLERGVAECPTVELLWLFYIKYLQSQIQQAQQQQKQVAQQRHQQQEELVHVLNQARNVASRSVRNCPYSVPLVQEQIKVEGMIVQMQPLLVLVMTNKPSSHFDDCLDPDVLLTQFIQPALDHGFLPLGINTWYELHRIVVLTVKRVLLSRLISVGAGGSSSSSTSQQCNSSYPLSYGDVEVPEQHRKVKNKTKSVVKIPDNYEINDSMMSDLMDIVEDLDDLYDELDKRLLAKYPSWTEGRSWLTKERGQTEAWVLQPLRRLNTNNTDDIVNRRNGSVSDYTIVVEVDEACKVLEKAVRLQNPPHPDTYLAYIRQWSHCAMNQRATSPIMVVSRLCQMRFLFQMAIQKVGRTKTSPNASLVHRDFDIAFHNLVYEWIMFEQLFGSDESLTNAHSTIRNKFRKLNVQPVVTNTGAVRELGLTAQTGSPEGEPHDDANNMNQGDHMVKSKRPLNQDHSDSQPNEQNTSIMRDAKRAKYEPELVEKKTPITKIKIGNLEYPVHPFTIRVSNLSPDSTDMDLVDLFRPRCGAVVHARIMRERHEHNEKGTSKGWGLVQFEERESVLKALQLHEVVGLHDKLLEIGHSHMPAASLVPPGMHRIQPKGGGKNSKRSMKKHLGQTKPMQESVEAKDSADLLDAPQFTSPVIETGKATGDSTTEAHTITSSAPITKPKPKPSSNLLSFRPRGVARASHHKVRVVLEGQKEK